jgi:hypothetical protein
VGGGKSRRWVGAISGGSSASHSGVVSLGSKDICNVEAFESLRSDDDNGDDDKGNGGDDNDKIKVKDDDDEGSMSPRKGDETREASGASGWV